MYLKLEELGTVFRKVFAGMQNMRGARVGVFAEAEWALHEAGKVRLKWKWRAQDTEYIRTRPRKICQRKLQAQNGAG